MGTVLELTYAHKKIRFDESDVNTCKALDALLLWVMYHLTSPSFLLSCEDKKKLLFGPHLVGESVQIEVRRWPLFGLLSRENGPSLFVYIILLSASVTSISRNRHRV